MLLPDIESLRSWEPGGPLDLTRATGGRLEGRRENRIIIRVTVDSSLDVAAIRPKLPGTEIDEEIDGRTETTLSNAQIILGKLYRSEQSVTRDAFDIVSIARADPRALEIAVNALNERDIQVVRSNLFASNDRMARNAKGVLHGIAPEYETDLRNLGRNASIATNAHRYERVRIQAESGRLTVEKRTKTGSLPDDIHDPETRTEGTATNRNRPIPGGQCRDLKSASPARSRKNRRDRLDRAGVRQQRHETLHTGDSCVERGTGVHTRPAPEDRRN